ncbi:MAG: hypothetical protein PF638_10025 [Candidatus Delongbacteria bacterium]|jgi:tetratricopeptide (TPR) repeat protein|nr:hypothetical protein [Candidatus Delongbacteria bacterium]
MKTTIQILILILSTLVFSQDNTYEIKKNTSFAVTKYKQKKYRSAMNYFEKVLKLDPDFKVVPFSILDKQARCYKELGLEDSAAIAYTRLNQLDPSNEIAQKNVEYKHFKNEDFSKASELSRKLAEENPDEPEHWKNAGDYLFRENNFKKNMNNILKYYQNYFKKKFDDETIKKVISLSKVKLTELQSKLIVNILELIIKNGSEDIEIKRVLAKYYIDSHPDKIKTAMIYLTEIEKKHPGDKKVKQLLVEAYTNDKNYTKALEYAENILTIEKLDYPFNYYNTYAKLCIELKNFMSARNKVNEGLKKYDDRAFNKILAKIYNASASSGQKELKYDDKLVFLIAFGLYNDSDELSAAAKLKASGLLPSKSDYFMNKDKLFPAGNNYKWINKEWKEVKYIKTYLNGL